MSQENECLALLGKRQKRVIKQNTRYLAEEEVEVRNSAGQKNNHIKIELEEEEEDLDEDEESLPGTKKKNGASNGKK